jgi:hypothetical protein
VDFDLRVEMFDPQLPRCRWHRCAASQQTN